jgi:hypothetical protein
VQHKGEIRSRFEGKVFLIDTGMLASYYPGGRPSALEIADGKFTAIYLDRRAVLLDPQRQPGAKPLETPGGGAAPQATQPEPLKRTFVGADGAPLPFSSDEEVIEFLRKAKLVSMKGIGEGITNPRRCLFELNGIRMHAIFRDVDEDKTIARMQRGTELMFRDSALFEPAAYELARMLGIESVPPAVERTVEGTSGSLQVWIEHAMTETTRRIKKKIPPPEPVMWTRQMNLVKVFDALIYNTDRNLGNLVIGPDWKLWMIDHTRAFRRHTDLQKPDSVQRCERRVFERMKELDKNTLRVRLKPYLREPEIDAILRRRDKLVAHIEQLIRERGEDVILYSMDAPIRTLDQASEVAATEEK